MSLSHHPVGLVGGRSGWLLGILQEYKEGKPSSPTSRFTHCLISEMTLLWKALVVVAVTCSYKLGGKLTWEDLSYIKAPQGTFLALPICLPPFC